MAKKTSKLSNVDKLMTEINSARKSLLNLRFQKSTGQLEKTSEIRKTRKQIAQLLTRTKDLENV